MGVLKKIEWITELYKFQNNGKTLTGEKKFATAINCVYLTFHRSIKDVQKVKEGKRSRRKEIWWAVTFVLVDKWWTTKKKGSWVQQWCFQ